MLELGIDGPTVPGGAAGLHTCLVHRLNHLESVKLPHRQCHQFAWSHGRRAGPRCALSNHERKRSSFSPHYTGRAAREGSARN